MSPRLNVIILFLLICSATSSIVSESNKVCRIDERRNTTGICMPLTDCPAVIGLLHAGVKPTVCSVQGPAMVCCPNKKRISSEKCDEFMKILTQPIKTNQALMFDGGHSEQNYGDSSIKCENFFLVFISGGTNAKLRQFPYQVALGYGEKSDWKCGGTLVDPSFVLTAAHCAKTIFGPPKVILLGDRKLSTKRDPSRLLVNVSEIYIHPKYQPPIQYNDIALIKLEKPVTLSRAILPACLPNPIDRLDRAVGVEATGWGRTGAFDAQSDILKSVTLAKFEKDECASFFKGENSNTDRLPKGIIRSQFCAGDKHGLRDTCQGDSGGPVTVEDKEYSCIRYVVGITSFGSTMCGYQQPGVYVNVLSYLDWIEDIVWGNSTTREGPKAQTSSYNSDGLIFDSIVTEKSTTTTASTNSMAYNTQSTTTAASTKIFNPTEIDPGKNDASSITTSTQPPTTTMMSSMSTTILQPVQQLNQKYLFNISSTIADLFNKLSFGR